MSLFLHFVFPFFSLHVLPVLHSRLSAHLRPSDFLQVNETLSHVYPLAHQCNLLHPLLNFTPMPNVDGATAEKISAMSLSLQVLRGILKANPVTNGNELVCLLQKGSKRIDL